ASACGGDQFRRTPSLGLLRSRLQRRPRLTASGAGALGGPLRHDIKGGIRTDPVGLGRSWVVVGAVVGGGSTHLFGRGRARVSVRGARGLNQPIGPPEGARAKGEFARAAASRRRISPSRRP